VEPLVRVASDRGRIVAQAHRQAHRMTAPNADKRGAAWRARSEATARAAARTKRLNEAQVTRSDEELIAEAIAVGKVRRIPTGTSGLPESEPSDNP
jgi:hypothetical protein